MLRDEIRDPVDIDILAILIETPDYKKRSGELEKELATKYKKVYSQESFHTHFNRSIKRLMAAKAVKKESRGHQNVIYCVPKGCRQAVKTFLEKMQNAKLFISLSIDEQKRLRSEVDCLRKIEYVKKLLGLPLPAFAIITECLKTNIDYKKFNPLSWEHVDFECSQESWRQSFPTSQSIEEKDKDDIEVKVVSDDELAAFFDKSKYEEKTKDFNELICGWNGWKIIGKSAENTVLACRLRIMGRLCEDTLGTVLTYLKSFFLQKLPGKYWNSLENHIRADPTIILEAELPTDSDFNS